MILATLDTNVLASGALDTRSAVAQVIEAWFRAEFVAVLSPYILGELDSALMKPYFARRLRAESIARYIALVRQFAREVPVTDSFPKVASHPEDDRVLATAVNGMVDYLVTGDKGLQVLGKCQEVTVLSPREFLRVLIGQSLR
ncbi:MAG: putative toxin-antitoxin system toxin component, PIN family [Chloroflexi bacterium]|nr:putative toxin-antitoxin system toxin component, PIN family [Chloroflexota bacterium]